MTAQPLCPEDVLREKLANLGYVATKFVTQTGVFWVNRVKKMYLQVPNSCDGRYPTWMLSDLAHQARQMGDGDVADAIEAIDPWKTMKQIGRAPARSRPKSDDRS